MELRSEGWGLIGDSTVTADSRHESTYIHGTTPPEQRRLSLLNGILNEASLRELGPCGGDQVLDVGSGLGLFSRVMARAANRRVVCVERSRDQLEEARRLAIADGEGDLIELREGDAIALPLREDEWGTFDIAHARYLLEHIPDPLAVVSSMVRAVRPGGRIILADDDHDLLRLWPEPPGVMSLWQAYVRTYDHLGNDPFVGRRLVSLLHSAGATGFRNTWVVVAQVRRRFPRSLRTWPVSWSAREARSSLLHGSNPNSSIAASDPSRSGACFLTPRSGSQCAGRRASGRAPSDPLVTER